MREHATHYLILTVMGILTAFGIDHYFFEDKMNVFLGLLIALGQVLALMLYDFVSKTK